MGSKPLVGQHRATALLGMLIATACGDEPAVDRFGHPPGVPSAAPVAIVDRFSTASATLMVRAPSNFLPGPGEPIDFDQGPFLAQGLSPTGTAVRYYALDIRSQVPAKLYSLLIDGETIQGQLPVLATIPGDAGYNDFVQSFQVAVPPDYTANAISSEDDVIASGYAVTATATVSNFPVVPPGSSAQRRWEGGRSELAQAWYRNQIAHFFIFESQVPASVNTFGQFSLGLSYLWAAFNVNPDQPGGGPPSGTRTEPDGVQSHNVLETLPGDLRYSPLWLVIMYDNAAFDLVTDITTAAEAPVVPGVPSPLVNCPVVERVE